MRSNIHKNWNKYGAWIIIGLFTIIYLCFPSINPSGDTLMYARFVRTGEELFWPHHLLYNVLYYGIAVLTGISDTLGLLSTMNALFAVGCLIVMKSILSRLTDSENGIKFLLFAGSCYGFMRYAITGETYIVPLFFSLLASESALRQKNVLLTGLWASVACLFHQIHFFWWLGLLIYILLINKEKKGKSFVLYGLVSCIVPVVYFLIFYLTPNNASNIFEYIAYDYFHKQGIEFSVGKQSLFLTPVNFIRTFYQVHGYLLPLVKKYPLLLLCIAFSIITALTGLLRLKSFRPTTHTERPTRIFALSHLIIFVLQLIFACGSVGNAEFMVMLPFALILFFAAYYSVQYFPTGMFAVSLFVWNVSIGIFPYHFLELMPERAIVRYVEQNPDEFYTLIDHSTVENWLEYQHPDTEYHLYSAIKLNENTLDSLLHVHSSITSDLWSYRAVSRATMLSNPVEIPQNTYIQQDTIPFDMGKLILTRISTIP